MIPEIIAIILMFIIIAKYKTELWNFFTSESFTQRRHNMSYNFDAHDINNKVLPNNSSFANDNDIMSYERETHNCKDDECERIDNYRHKFFEFNDRVNHNSHLGDSVDNINITNKAQDYKIGMDISAIYDDLVNSNEYKTVSDKSCV